MSGHTSSQGVPALLRELRDAGPQDRIPAFFEQNYVQAWYGTDLLELRTVLDAAPENELRKHPLTAYVRSVLRGEPALTRSATDHRTAVGRGFHPRIHPLSQSGRASRLVALR